MFAIEDIQQNETLLVIPSECLLTSDLRNGKENPSYNMCDTARHVVQEYQRLQTTGDSDYAPYINYIFEQKQHEKVPAAWSEEGISLLQRVIGDELEPQGVDEMDFFRRCGTPEDRKEIQKQPPELRKQTAQLYVDAYRSVVSRSWNDVLVPVFDLVNHRNGKYHNMDQLTTTHAGEDVVIVALRDVQLGEQLYISYNECHDEDCDGIAHTYILPQIMKDYGFVEQYPHRWRFTYNSDEEDAHILIELEEDETTGELRLIWLSEEPDRGGISFLRGHLKRQQDIHDELVEETKTLAASYEKETIMEFHEALMTALKMAIQEAGRAESALGKPEKDCLVEPDGSQTCTLNTDGRYDSLIPLEGEGNQKDGDEDSHSVCSSAQSRYLGEAEYEHLDETESFYQTITYEHNNEIDDTCLYLSGWLQTCSSWRPQYHESVVHVPASFLANVTRVIYLGGGDNMLLHEILKYRNTLEMVLGMELDQQVVRTSFKVLGNQPHFDNPKVQWWFGDATKSLNLLPKDYFGTFDLVIVDLQTNVIETLQVTPTKTIMDAAVGLLKPEGILARNEDFYPRRSVGFAKYEVDLELVDVPMLCQQSITMGSKTVDFLVKTPKDHGIRNNLYQQSVPDAFVNWYGYRNNPGFDKNEGAFEIWAEESTLPTGNYGVHLILEVENDALHQFAWEQTRKSISMVIAQVGFAEMSVTEPSTTKEKIAIFLFQEGYLLAQFWPKQGVGFDLKLWSKFDQLETIKASLIAAVQGQAFSSFRVVTGGMFGLVETAKRKTGSDAGKPADSQDHDLDLTLGEDAIATIVQEAVSLIPSGQSIVAVVCPEKIARCQSLESLFKRNVHFTRKVIPIYTCSGLADEHMYKCETDILKAIVGDLKEVGSKIGGILFDADVPKSMGQILHTLLSDKSNRIDLLEQKYVVLFTTQEPSPFWQRALLERIQTDLDPFSPAMRTQAFFNGTTSSVELGVFSSGNPTFVADLVSMLGTVKQKTGLFWEVRKVEDGVIGYVADFFPSVVPSNADYNKTEPLRQWSSQSPLGQQTILQFGIQRTHVGFEIGEVVLVEYTQDRWKGEWLIGRVQGETGNGKYIVELEDEEEMEVESGSIRQLDFSSDLSVMDQVLIQRSNYWSQGAIIERSLDGRSFAVRRFDSNGDVMTVKRKDMVPWSIPSDRSSEVPSLMNLNLPDAIRSSLQSMDIDLDTDHNFHSFWGIGLGCIIVAFWSSGSTVVTWDGKTHIDVGLFTNEEHNRMREEFVDGIIEAIPFLVVTSRDDHPRGFGRVVNFLSDLESTPRWVADMLTQQPELE